MEKNEKFDEKTKPHFSYENIVVNTNEMLIKTMEIATMVMQGDDLNIGQIIFRKNKFLLEFGNELVKSQDKNLKKAFVATVSSTLLGEAVSYITGKFALPLSIAEIIGKYTDSECFENIIPQLRLEILTNKNLPQEIIDDKYDLYLELETGYYTVGWLPVQIHKGMKIVEEKVISFANQFDFSQLYNNNNISYLEQKKIFSNKYLNSNVSEKINYFSDNKTLAKNTHSSVYKLQAEQSPDQINSAHNIELKHTRKHSSSVQPEQEKISISLDDLNKTETKYGSNSNLEHKKDNSSETPAEVEQDERLNFEEKLFDLISPIVKKSLVKQFPDIALEIIQKNSQELVDEFKNTEAATQEVQQATEQALSSMSESNNIDDKKLTKIEGKNQNKFLGYLAPKILKTAEDLAAMAYQWQQIDDHNEAFKVQKTNIRQQIDKKLVSLKFDIDNIHAYTGKNFSLPQMQEYMYSKCKEGILVGLINQRKSYVNISKNLDNLKNKIDKNKTFLNENQQQLDKVLIKQEKLMYKIKKLKYDSVLPKVASGLALIGTFSPEATTKTVASFASSALTLISGNKQNKIDKRFKKYNKILQDTDFQINCLHSQKMHLHNEIDVLESLQTRLENEKAKSATAAQYREQLKTAISKRKDILVSLEQQKIELITDSTKLIKQESKEKKELEKKQKKKARKRLKAETKLQETQFELLANQKAQDDLLQEHRDCVDEITQIEEKLILEEELKGVKDWFDEYKSNLHDSLFKGLNEEQIKQKKILLETRLILKSQYAEYQQLFAEQDSVVRATGAQLSGVLHLFEMLLQRKGHTRSAQAFNLAEKSVQGAMLLYQGYRIVTTLQDHSTVKLLELIKNSSKVLSGIKQLGLIQTLTEFINPMLGLIQLGTQLLVLIGSVIFNFDLFTDPVISKLKELSEKIDKNFASLRERLEQEFDDVKETLSEIKKIAELNLAYVKDTKILLNTQFDYLNEITINDRSNEVLRKIQEVEKEIVKITNSSSYREFSTNKLNELYAMLGTFSEHACDNNLTKIYISENDFPSIATPIDAINIIAEKTGLLTKVGSSYHSLANYHILYVINEAALYEYPNFIKILESFNNNKSQVQSIGFKKNNESIKEFIHEISKKTFEFNDFLESMRSSYEWIDKLSYNIKAQLETLLAIFNKCQYEEQIQNKEESEFKRVCSEYKNLKIQYVNEKWFYSKNSHETSEAVKKLLNDGVVGEQRYYLHNLIKNDLKRNIITNITNNKESYFYLTNTGQFKSGKCTETKEPIATISQASQAENSYKLIAKNNTDITNTVLGNLLNLYDVNYSDKNSSMKNILCK